MPILIKVIFLTRELSRSSLSILCIALTPQSGDFAGAILEVPSEALLHLSVVARCFEARYKRGKRKCNLNKQHFLVIFNRIPNTSYNWRSCLPCTALPYSHMAAYPQFNTPPIHEIGRGPRRSRHSMYFA